MPNIIHDASTFHIEERITTNGVERRIGTAEPAGNDRDAAYEQLRARIAANRPAYAPATGIRLVLIGGDR